MCPLWYQVTFFYFLKNRISRGYSILVAVGVDHPIMWGFQIIFTIPLLLCLCERKQENHVRGKNYLIAYARILFHFKEPPRYSK